MGTWGVSGANDGIWFHDASGWRMATAPVAGAFWRVAASNPFNKQEIVIVGNSWSYLEWPSSPGNPLKMHDGTHSAAWRSTDGGATWSALTLTQPATGGRIIVVQDVGWASVGGWYVYAVVRPDMGSASSVVWREGAAYQETGAAYSGIGRAAPGQDGEIAIGKEGAQGVMSVNSTGVWSTPQNAPGGAYLLGGIAVVPGKRLAYLIDGNTSALYTTPDYRSSAITTWAGAPALGGIIAMADGSVYGYRIVGTNAEIVSVQAGGSSAVVATLPAQYLSYLVSNASRSAIAGAAAFYGFVYWDGATWDKIDFPTGLGSSDLGRLAITDEPS